ncbi:MAG TPA: hypothetical protein VHZ25_04055, partial [Acidobacteriaceae bacterium]|nr:hypothetical protein [Acidobacteriaceae bacterium]
MAETLSIITDAESSPRTDQESAPHRTPAGIGGLLIFVLLELWISAAVRLVAGSPRLIAFIGVGGVHVNRTPAGLLPALTNIVFGLLGVIAGLLLARKSSKGLIFAKIVLLTEAGFYAVSLFNVLVATGPAVATAVPVWVRPAGCLLASVLCIFYLFRSRRIVNTFFAASTGAAATATDPASEETDHPRSNRRTWDDFAPGQADHDADAVDPRIERIRPWTETRFVLKADPAAEPAPPLPELEGQPAVPTTVVFPRARRVKDANAIPYSAPEPENSSNHWSWPPETGTDLKPITQPAQHVVEPHSWVQAAESQPWPLPEIASPAPETDDLHLHAELPSQPEPALEDSLPAPQAHEPEAEPEAEPEPEPTYLHQPAFEIHDFQPAPQAADAAPTPEDSEALPARAEEHHPESEPEPRLEEPQQPTLQAEELQPEPVAEHTEPQQQPEPVAEESAPLQESAPLPESAPLQDPNELVTLKVHIIDGAAQWLSSPSNNTVHASFLREASTSGELHTIQTTLLSRVTEICDHVGSVHLGQFPTVPNTADANGSLSKELQKWAIAQAAQRLFRSLDIRAAIEMNGPFENLIENRDYLISIVEENSSEDVFGQKLSLPDYEASSALEIAFKLILQAQKDMYEAEMWAQVASLAGDSNYLHTFADSGQKSFQLSVCNWSARLTRMHDDRRNF